MECSEVPDCLWTRLYYIWSFPQSYIYILLYIKCEGLIIGAVNIKYPFKTFMNNWKET
jgi:hypothetical protein